MNQSMESSGSKRGIDQAVDISVRLAFIGLIVFWCTKIVAPFFLPVLWGVIIATALYPVFLKLKGWFGGRNTLAGAVFIVGSLAFVLVPTALLTDSLIDGATGLSRGLEEGTLTIPPPSDSVREWPAIGEQTHATWQQASLDFRATLAKYTDQFKALGNFIVAGAASLGGAVVQTIFALILAGIFMMNAVGSGRVAYAFAERIGGAQGRELVDISIATVRSVVKGVLLVAIIQSLMAAAGLIFAGVGGAGFWALIVLVLAIVQLPPILILGPIAAYVFSAHDSTVVAIVFLIWSLVVSGADSFLKPMFLGRGVAVPMLVILVGAIGGMIAAGVIGLFLGAVILSVGFKLVETYLGDSLKSEEDPES